MKNDTGKINMLTPVREFFEKYGTIPGSLLDVGVGDPDLLKIVKEFGHSYTTLNIIGKCDYNVANDPYNWPIIDNTFDYVLSITTFEHIEFPWLTFLEMVRVTKQNGHILIMAPSAGSTHGYWDGWRYYEDSMRSFAKWGKVELLNVFIDNNFSWKFCIGIFKKV